MGTYGPTLMTAPGPPSTLSWPHMLRLLRTTCGLRGKIRTETAGQGRDRAMARQYGLYFWADQGGSDAGRDAARLSAVGKPTDCPTFEANVTAPIDSMGNNFDITRTYTDSDGDGQIEVGDNVTVTVTFDSIDLQIPFLPFIDHGQVSSTAKARVEYVNDGQPANCS
jgi:hypothetical protein